MVVGLIVVLIVLILCSTTLLGIYMSLCSVNEVRMFADPQYDERIKKLEKQMEELKKE